MLLIYVVHVTRGNVFYVYLVIQDIHKRMMLFQKLINPNPTWHNIRCQQRGWSKFLVRYQRCASQAYCGAAGQVSKMASQQEKSFCVLRIEVSRSVITV
jgi:hypothetical protein